MVLNTIYNEDCLETMSKMEDKSIDLIITSPPYNMGGKSLGYKPRSKICDKHYDVYCDDRNEQEYVEWCMKVISECLRVSRYVFWNVQFVKSTRNMIFELQREYMGNIKEIFIWQKQAVANITADKGALAKGWEYVFMLGEDNTATFNYNNFPDNKYVPNIKAWYKNETFKQHSATFPVSMTDYFVEYFTKEGDIVYDPFMGMGTTAVSCAKWKRKFIGSEISNEYRNDAEKRVIPYLAQTSLF